MPIYPKGEKAVPLPRNQMTSLVAGHFFLSLNMIYYFLIFKFMKKMKVVKLLDVQSGVSQQTGNPWKSREVVVESMENAVHPDRYVARLFGDAVDKFTANEGDVLGIGLRHSVREYNGRYYGETHISEFEQVQPF